MSCASACVNTVALARAVPPHRRQGRLGAAGRPRARRAEACLARLRWRRISPTCMRAGPTCWWCRPARSRWAARVLGPARRRLEARGKPGRRRRRADRAGAQPGPRCWASTASPPAQILVTLGDTEERRRYLNARATLGRLLELGAVPVINENDTVATTRDPLRRQRSARRAGRAR